MRQFVLDSALYGGDADDDEEVTDVTGKKRFETFDSKIVYRKGRPVNTLCSTDKVRNISSDLRKAAIQYIIK